MNTEDRKFATEWVGFCYHEADPCLKCGMAHNGNRTFTTPNDVYWLIGKLKENKKLGQFSQWTKNLHTQTLGAWLLQLPAEQCQLIVDFLREIEPCGEK
jgi:hypothetical protein